MARGCQSCSTKVPLLKTTNCKAKSQLDGGYSESTILPGAVPMGKGEPEIAVGAPVEGL